MATLTEADWDSRFTAVPSPSGEDYWEFYEIADIAQETPAERIWTLVEGADQPEDMSDEDYEDGKYFEGRYGYLLVGYHYVNAISYTITEEPWTAEDENNEWTVGD